MVVRKICSVVVLAALALWLSALGGVPQGTAQPKSPEATTTAPVQQYERGHVYMLRGLANVWSRGIDKMAEQLKARGVRLSVHNHANSRKLAAEAIEKYKADPNFGPIIIVGHSLGADASVLMAEQIGAAGVPVRLMVMFDGVARQDVSKRGKRKDDEHQSVSRVTANVQEVLNFYISTGWGREMVPGKGFNGKIENVDVEAMPKVNHINIEKNPELQARAIERILQVLDETRGKRAKTATN